MPGHVLIVDCYDSFTYNLSHLCEAIIDSPVVVLRLHEVTPGHISQASHILFSPGPGLPEDTPYLLELLSLALKEDRPVLGVCLGMQAMALWAGAKLINLREVFHGVASEIMVQPGAKLFEGMPASFTAGRYHSWVVNATTLSRDWQVTAVDRQGRAMAMQHRHAPWFGIQFHPESVMTPLGRDVLQNFLRL